MIGWFSALGRSILEEWGVIRKEKILLFLLMAVPLVYPPTVSYIYSRNAGVERPAIIVDQDNSALSRRLTFSIDATQEAALLARIDSLEEGFDKLARGEAEALLYIPPDFSSRIKQGSRGVVKAWIGAGNIFTYGVSYPAIAAVVGRMNADLAREKLYARGVNRHAAEMRVPPLILAERFLFHPTVGYGNFFVPGIMIMVIQQLMLIGLAFSVGLQRDNGTFDERPRRPDAYWLGKSLAQSVFYLGGAAFILLAVFPSFGWSLASALSAMALFVAFIVAMTPASILVASFFRDHYAAFEFLMYASAPAFLMSGFSWPLDQMPTYLRALAYVFPATPALNALRIVTMKSADLTLLSPLFGQLLLQGLIYGVLSFIVLRRNRIFGWTGRTQIPATSAAAAAPAPPAAAAPLMNQAGADSGLKEDDIPK